MAKLCQLDLSYSVTKELNIVKIVSHEQLYVGVNLGLN